MTSSVLVEPSWSSTPPYERTLGPEVADLAALAGFEPDPEQRLALDMMFALDRSGRAASFEFGIICSRQNMKTGLFKMAALGWLFITDQRLTVWSAHEFRTAQEAYRDMEQLVHAHPAIARRVKHAHSAAGNEAIELHNGNRLIFKARTKGGGRGLSGDKVVLDEAFALKPAHMGALLPTLSARPDPQVIYGSSAGLVDSDVLRAIRDRGRLGGDPSLAYLEWGDRDAHKGCAAEDCDHRLTAVGCALDDRDRWARANPQFGQRITEEYIAAERRALPPEEFARERLGWWDEPGIVENGLTLTAWTALTDPDAAPTDPVVFGLDAAPGLSSASVVAAGGDAIELVKRGAGTDWLVEFCVGLQGRHSPVGFAYDPSGPIGSIVPDLVAADVKLIPVEGKDSVFACGAFVAAVVAKSLRHRGEPEFRDAVAGARRRSVGDGHKWSRKDSSVDITPLVAATVAWWVATTAPPAPVSAYEDGDLMVV